MKKLFLYFVPFFMAAVFIDCSSKDVVSAGAVVEKTPSTLVETMLDDVDGCFLLFDMKTNAWVEQVHSERCQVRVAPCSTFKVPLAVMAFDAHALKDENTVFKWDGKKRMLPEWNRDQTAADWMKNSTLWYSQKITKKMGRKSVQAYLTKFDYGNKDFSGGLTDAWLTPSPHSSEKVKSSVQISGYEQIEFWKKLWTNKLPASNNSMDLAKKITFLETTPGGFTLSGKTGSGYTGPSYTQRLGWFVAHIQKKDEEYLAVVNFNDIKPQETPFAGRQAKEMMIQYLKNRNLY